MHLPPPQRIAQDKARAISPFVRRAIARSNLTVASKILDLPCGTGRHATWLAELGHRVTVCDIDPGLVAHVVGKIRSQGRECDGLAVDASLPLPFVEGAFDAVLIVDLVLESLLDQIGEFVAPGGMLIYQTYAGRGQNWKQLQAPGRTVQVLERSFEIVEFLGRVVGPNHCEAEAVRLIGRKITKSV